MPSERSDGIFAGFETGCVSYLNTVIAPNPMPGRVSDVQI
ncbi:hypothetical protein NEILACOT_03574 [Neisseria lactamica ATCC 23970]|uniref:Uncharacterized protein n=1 Tax=Neisseria lactamica ATCC 23970 TaxID=546265 RepID=D0W7S4_NEILA|nr:hypothetical protein NEILACOT_03574 [Neisseria lactamica ATCC 23970]